MSMSILISVKIKRDCLGKELFPEREGYLDVYHHYGLTGAKSVFAHCVHLEEGSGSVCIKPTLRLPSAQPQTCSWVAVCFR